MLIAPLLFVGCNINTDECRGKSEEIVQAGDYRIVDDQSECKDNEDFSMLRCPTSLNWCEPKN